MTPNSQPSAQLDDRLMPPVPGGASAAHAGLRLVRPQPMVERMARAIAASEGSSDWRSFVEAARAVAAALREPTSDMLDAATPGLADWGYLPDDWRAMIDRIIAEPGP